MKRSHPPIRILVADGQTILRAGLRNLLEKEADLKVAGETADCRETATLASELKPDILIIDQLMLGSAEAELLLPLFTGRYKIRTIVLASSGGLKEIPKAFTPGVRGIVLKDSATKVLIQGIRSVMEGNFWLGHEAVVRVGSNLSKLPILSAGDVNVRTFGLTKRELEIVGAIVSGYSNKEIAKKLSISEDTVKHHVTNIFDKVGAYNRLELSLFAIHHGLVGTQHERSIAAKSAGKSA